MTRSPCENPVTSGPGPHDDPADSRPGRAGNSTGHRSRWSPRRIELSTVRPGRRPRRGPRPRGLRYRDFRDLEHLRSAEAVVSDPREPSRTPRASAPEFSSPAGAESRGPQWLDAPPVPPRRGRACRARSPRPRCAAASFSRVPDAASSSTRVDRLVRVGRGAPGAADHDADLAPARRRPPSPRARRAGPRRTSSWSLVSSRHTAARRSAPNASASAARLAASRDGASKKTSVRRSPASSARRRIRSPGLRGRKPSNANRSVGSPDTASAVITALGPGSP